MNLESICVSCMEDDSGSPVCPKCGSPFRPTVSNMLMLPPRTVLREQYLIGRALGHGGFGITYLAWDIGLETRLAVKEYMPNGVAGRTDQTKVVPFSDITRQEYEWGLERFLEEARTLKKCNHPNIVPVDTVFRDNGTAYLVMEYLEGTTFGEFLRRRGGTIPFEDALRVMLPVMDALSAVHAENIVHRDVSPDNIYIPRVGKVKLIDFGAARNALSQKSRNLSVILKAGYAPEEQYRISGVQGPWTDVYATAATFYRAVAGKVPPAALDRQAEDTLERLSQLGVAIPASAESALMKALEVRAGARFQSMEDFKNALTGNSSLPLRSAAATASATASRAPAFVPPETAPSTAPAPPVSQLPDLEDAIKRYEGSLESSRRPLRVARPLPKWLAPAVLAGIVVLAAVTGLVWYRGHHRPAAPPKPLVTQWPAQPAGIPQSDEERQRLLEAQVQQEQNPVAPTPEPAAAPQPIAAASPGLQTKKTAPAPASASQSAASPPTATAVIAPTPQPVPPPPPVVQPATPVVSYDDMLAQAQNMIGKGQYTPAQALLKSAIQAKPGAWQAYNALAQIELYQLNSPADAFTHYQAALAKGGVATFRVSREHEQGWLSVSAGKAGFKADGGMNNFPVSAVKEAKGNKIGKIMVGKAHHAFHILLMNGVNYNFAPTSTDPGEEVSFIVSAIGS
jgi:serine/threonine protein kinase